MINCIIFCPFIYSEDKCFSPEKVGLCLLVVLHPVLAAFPPVTDHAFYVAIVLEEV